MKLYELSCEYEKVLNEAFVIAEENEGVIPDSLSEALDGLEMELNQKIENCAVAYKNFVAEAAAIKAERDKLMAREKSLFAKSEWIKKYINTWVKAGEKKVFSRASLSWRASSSVEVTDLNKVPSEYCKITVEPKLKLIRESANLGFDITSFAKIVDKKSLVIK